MISDVLTTDEIVQAGLCIGCGLCVGVVGSDRLRLVMTPEGRERPMPIDRLSERENALVNAICPGAKSAAFKRIMAEHPELESAADASNPMGRIGDPEDDIAPVALFLASDDCRYVTGNTLYADGGGHINGVAWAPELEAQ